MDRLYHNSLLLSDRTPFGAVAAGTRVCLTAHTDGAHAGDAVFLRLWREETGETVLPARTENGCDWTVALTVPEEPCIVYYRFYLVTAEGDVFHCCAVSGEGLCSREEGDSWRITVYDGAFETPRWFREGIVYQIFPDRFCRSSWEDFRGRAEAHRAKGRRVRLHDDWNDEPDYLAAPGEKDYEPVDYFGGDLEGIRRKLPYLKKLGVTCLYLNPIFEAASNHRYNTADYLTVDPLLGTADDLRALCRDAGEQGIRVMLDGVFSHTGSDSRYFNRAGTYPEPGAYQGPASPYYEWYDFSEFPDRYDCWWGFKTLPNVREMTPSYVDFITGEDGMLSRWRDCGVTSWRLDVADELPDAFIRALRKRVKANDPDGVLLGEVWEECSAKRGPEGRRGYVNGDELDSAMDYPFTNAVLDYCGGKTGAKTLLHVLTALREWYPEPFWKAQLNLLSSHDVIRAITRLSGAPDRDALSRERQAVYRPSASALAAGKKRYLSATAIQMFCPGVPCVYYGDEAGVTGMADPFNRAPYPWGREDAEILARVRTLAMLRHDLIALKQGHCRMGAPARDVFAVVRYTEESAAVLLVNNGPLTGTVRLDAEALREGPDTVHPIPRRGYWTDEYGREAADPFTGEVAVPPEGTVIRLLKKRTD